MLMCKVIFCSSTEKPKTINAAVQLPNCYQNANGKLQTSHNYIGELLKIPLCPLGTVAKFFCPMPYMHVHFQSIWSYDYFSFRYDRFCEMKCQL